MDKLPHLSPEETARLIDDLIAGRPIPPEPDAIGLEEAVGEVLDDVTRDAFAGMAHIVKKVHPQVPLPLVVRKAHALAYVAARIYRAEEAEKAFAAWEEAGEGELVSGADRAIATAVHQANLHWKRLMRYLLAQNLDFFCPPGMQAEG
jgi:hypothetical protein